MSYAIIGFGKIGHALAKAFARSGIEVCVATTRDPESFAADAAAIGPTIVPKKPADANVCERHRGTDRLRSHPLLLFPRRYPQCGVGCHETV
jgi:3-hydroxyacyl-CoA dehydrogenase